jgi:hypothetical protein
MTQCKHVIIIDMAVHFQVMPALLQNCVYVLVRFRYGTRLLQLLVAYQACQVQDAEAFQVHDLASCRHVAHQCTAHVRSTWYRQWYESCSFPA